jgi:hypothetical protein
LIDRSDPYKFHCDGTYGTTLNQTRNKYVQLQQLTGWLTQNKI